MPTLATHSDISDIRSQIRGTENRLIMWGIGAVIALAATLVAMITANTARIDTQAGRMDAALAEIRADNRTTNARIDRLDEKIDARFDALMAELRAQRGAGE